MKPGFLFFCALLAVSMVVVIINLGNRPKEPKCPPGTKAVEIKSEVFCLQASKQEAER